MSTVVLLLILSLNLRLSTCDVHIYVSPHGSDHNDGHSDKVPLKSVYTAVSRAGQSKYKNETVYIELMHGRYDLDRTLTISRKNTVMRSYRHQEVHVTGGHRIPSTSVKPVTDHKILARLPANARAHVRVVNLRSLNITDFGKMDEYGSGRHRSSPLEVFFNGQALHLARWPNNDYLDIVAVPDGRYGTRFRYNSTVPGSWHNESDPWVYGFWYYGWADRSEQVKSIDTHTKTVTIFHKTPHGIRTGHLHEYQKSVSNREGGYFYFINILSALDEPGEYYMDRQSGNLYMWVPNRDGSVKTSDIVYVSRINNCIQVGSHTENVRLEDFTLEVCRRTGIYSPNVKGVKVYNMEIRNTGNVAAYFAGNCRECEISRCYIHDTCGGIWMYGGDRHTLESSGNTVSNNEITRVTRVGDGGNYGLNIVGVGVRAEYNHIYNSQNLAINFAGNDIVMEHNLIHDVCTNTAGCAAIRTSNDWTYRGNKIRYNIIHHTLRLVPGTTNSAILLDGQTSGTSVMYNALFDNYAHVVIHGGRYNMIENNVMYNATSRSIEVDNRGTSHRSDASLLQKLRAMPYNGTVWSLRYPQLANIDKRNASLPEGNQIVRNIIYAGPHTEYIHGISALLKPDLSRYFNISQTGFSSGSSDHFSVTKGDLRVRCKATDWANRVNFKQPPSPNDVGPSVTPVGPNYLHRGRVHLVNTTYSSQPCTSPAPRKDPLRSSYLPDSFHNDLYHVEKVGCWLNVTKCRNHPASVGTYRDMYGERYHHAADNVTMCFRRAVEQWKMCGSHKDELVAVIYGPTGEATLGGSGCFTATYGCPKHGGPVGGHDNSQQGKYYHDGTGERTHTEKGCLSHARNIWRYCGSSPSYPITNVYLPTGAKLTAGGGCWIALEKCPAHTKPEKIFYDAIGSTNYQTDHNEFACLHRAEYYWYYCGSHAKYPVTATYRPTTASQTYP